MSQAEPTPAPADGPKPDAPRRQPLLLALKVALTVAVVGLLLYGGVRAWRDYQSYSAQWRESEDSAPVGYVGLNFRRSYNDRPARYQHERDGRKLLWAAQGEGPGSEPDYYDVTDADFEVHRLGGGYGRDSIPGVDYPIFEPRDSERGGRLRERQEVFGLVLGDGPRAYPMDLLRKIQVVNDRDGDTPFVVVFDGGGDVAQVFERRLRGEEVTFGTTGYTLPTAADGINGKPLLYDRKTRSLWLTRDDALVCVSGEAKGTKIPSWRPAEEATWGDWSRRQPKTRVLFGNDRSKPIPPT